MKKIVSTIMCICLCCVIGGKAYAANVGDCIDGSYLTNEESSTVTVGAMTKGTYLRSGTSTINKAGAGMISAGGDTTGQTVVSSISVYCRVERLIGSSWCSYGDGFSATKSNAAYVSASRTRSVPTGYYYRVISTHYANTDVSYSFTDGIYI